MHVELPTLAVERPAPEGDTQTLPRDERSLTQLQEPSSDRRQIFSKLVPGADTSQEDSSAARHGSSQFPRRHRKFRSKDFSGHRYPGSHSLDPNQHASMNSHSELVVMGKKD